MCSTRAFFKSILVLFIIAASLLSTLPLFAAQPGDGPHFAYSNHDQELAKLKDFKVKTQEASDIQANSAVLNGQLIYQGPALNIQVSFEWGTISGNYTRETTPLTMMDAGYFSTRLAGLASDTTYYYRVKAEGDVVRYGAQLSFTTAQDRYTLTINVTGGGTVSPGAGKYVYSEGTEVSLSATPVPGWSFGGWQGDLGGSVNPTTIVMDSDKTVIAAFVQLTSPNPPPTVSPSPTLPPTTSPPPTVSPSPIASPSPAGGGFFGGSAGGGSGSGGSGDRIYLSRYMTGTPGVFTSEADLKSIDGLLRITFPKGTRGGTAEGWALSYVILTPVPADQQDLPLPENGSIIGLTYQLEPEGAAFSPPASITMLYKDNWMPPGMSGKDLVIGYWDAGLEQWVPLAGCVVDSENRTVTAPLSHFSTYTVLGFPSGPALASFTLSGLAVSPSETSPGREVIITATVANTGGSAGKYVVNLQVNGTTAESREVDLEAGSSAGIKFTILAGRIGSYNIDLNGDAGELVVTGPSPLATAVPAPQAAVSTRLPVGPGIPPVGAATITAGSQSENKASLPSFGWIIAATAVLAGLVVVFVISRRTDQK